MSSADVRHPTCQCTEEVTVRPSCPVPTNHFNQNLPFQHKHTETGTWRASPQNASKRRAKNSRWRQSSASAGPGTSITVSVTEGKGPTQPSCWDWVRLWRKRQEGAQLSQMGGEEWVWREGVWRALREWVTSPCEGGGTTKSDNWKEG